LFFTKTTNDVHAGVIVAGDTIIHVADSLKADSLKP
jgi:hypothetical protein